MNGLKIHRYEVIRQNNATDFLLLALRLGGTPRRAADNDSENKPPERLAAASTNYPVTTKRYFGITGRRRPVMPH